MRGRNGIVFCESAQAFGDAEASEVLTLLQVVAGVVRRGPMRDGIDIQLNLLAGLRFADKHLSRRDEAGDQIQFRVVQMECFAVEIAVHLRVRKEDLRWAALGDNLQHARLLKLLDGVRCENHRGIVLPPGFLCGDDVAANRLVLDEEPCFVQQEHLERGKLLRVGNLVEARCKT